MSAVNRPSPAAAAACLPLERFGYSAHDAGFLADAVRLGGYFLRRQYGAYAGRGPGGCVTAFVRRATELGQIQAVGGRSLYRATGRELHGALGLEVTRKGARRGVKQRLLALDYYLAERRSGARWLLDLAAKATALRKLGIPEPCWPTAPRAGRRTGRRFPGGFPVSLAGDPPTVRCSYAHAGATATGFERHLRLHEPLGAALAARGAAFEWVVLADTEEQFLRLRHAFGRWQAAARREAEEGEWFGLRALLDRNRWRELSVAALDRCAELRARLDGDGAEKRYRAWLQAGQPPVPDGAGCAAQCGYREVLLDFDYSLADAVEAAP